MSAAMIEHLKQLGIGEKVEAIVLQRESGMLGEYLGSSAKTFGAAKVDGLIFKVERCVEAGSAWFWRVLNVNTGKIVSTDDEYCLPNAIEEAAAV